MAVVGSATLIALTASRRLPRLAEAGRHDHRDVHPVLAAVAQDLRYRLGGRGHDRQIDAQAGPLYLTLAGAGLAGIALFGLAACDSGTESLPTDVEPQLAAEGLSASASSCVCLLMSFCCAAVKML